MFLGLLDEVGGLPNPLGSSEMQDHNGNIAMLRRNKEGGRQERLFEEELQSEWGLRMLDVGQ